MFANELVCTALSLLFDCRDVTVVTVCEACLFTFNLVLSRIFWENLKTFANELSNKNQGHTQIRNNDVSLSSVHIAAFNTESWCISRSQKLLHI